VFLEACLHSCDTKNEILIKKLLVSLHEFILPACTTSLVYTYLLTYLLTYLITYLLHYLLNYLLNCLLT